MSSKNVEMMKKLLEEKKNKNAAGNSQRPDKKLGNDSREKSNKRIGIRKV